MLGATLLKSKEIFASITEPSFYVGILTSFLLVVFVSNIYFNILNQIVF